MYFTPADMSFDKKERCCKCNGKYTWVVTQVPLENQKLTKEEPLQARAVAGTLGATQKAPFRKYCSKHNWWCYLCDECKVKLVASGDIW